MPQSYVIATLATGVDFRCAAALWHWDWSRLTLLDMDAAPLAQLDRWCTGIAARLRDEMVALGHFVPEPERAPFASYLASLNPAPDSRIYAYAEAGLAEMATLRGLQTQPVPEAWAALDPAKLAVTAATYMAGGRVVLSPAAQAKCRRHPFSAVTNWREGQPRSGVVEAFALGPMVAFRAQ